MRDTIRPVTASDVCDIGSTWGFDVDEAEAAALADAVNDRLDDDLDAVYEVPIPTNIVDPGQRTWSEGNDEHNAIRVDCHVPPVPDHEGALEDFTVGIKDLIAVAGVPMQCGSSVMEGYVPNADATVVKRLRQAGATITAKTTMDEFAGGGRGRTYRGLVRNPRDKDRIAGGSSGGSGAAVAAGLVDVALGTDTGGSTRKPAAFCGVVGLKPTYGLVPLGGVVENTYSMDHVGPIGTSVSEVAAVLSAIAGKDRADPASMVAAGGDRYDVGGYKHAATSPPPVDDLRLGIATQGLTDNIDRTVAARHEAATDALEANGATLVDIELPYLDATKHIKNVTSYTELAAFWRDRGLPIRRGGWVDPGDRVGFARRAESAARELNDFYRGRMIAGAHLADTHDGRHYTRAQAARQTIQEALDERLDGLDAILTPTVPQLAPKVEHVLDPEFDYDGLGGAFGYGRYTKIANVTGAPAISVPNETAEGPAVGMQLIGSRFDEPTLLGAATRVSEVVGVKA